MKKLLLGLALFLTISAQAFTVIPQGWCSWNGGKGLFMMVGFPYNTEVQVRKYPSSTFVEAFTTPTLASGGNPNHLIQAPQSSVNNPVSIQFRYRTVGNSAWSDWVGDSDTTIICWITNIVHPSGLCMGLAVNEYDISARRTGSYVDVTVNITNNTRKLDLEISGRIIPINIPPNTPSGKYIIRLSGEKIISFTKSQ